MFLQHRQSPTRHLLPCARTSLPHQQSVNLYSVRGRTRRFDGFFRVGFLERIMEQEPRLRQRSAACHVVMRLFPVLNETCGGSHRCVLLARSAVQIVLQILIGITDKIKFASSRTTKNSRGPMWRPFLRLRAHGASFWQSRLFLISQCSRFWKGPPLR